MYFSEEPPKVERKWVDQVDFNPDHRRSSSRSIVDEVNLYWILEVKQLGAIVMRAELDEDGNPVFKGISEFTSEQIHTGRL